MAIPLNTPESPSHSERALRELALEQKRSASEKKTAWAVVWTLFTFKIATVGLIWYAASGSSEANDVLIATTWYWMAIPLVAVSGMVAYRWRLYQARRRRKLLHSSEWMAHEREDGGGLTDEDVRLLLSSDEHRDRDNRSSL